MKTRSKVIYEGSVLLLLLIAGSIVLIGSSAYLLNHRSQILTRALDSEKIVHQSTEVTPRNVPVSSQDVVPQHMSQDQQETELKDYSNCFHFDESTAGMRGGGGAVSMQELDAVEKAILNECPIYVLQDLKRAPISGAFKERGEITILQSGAVYILRDQKPIYDFDLDWQSEITYKIYKNFVDSSKQVLLDGKPILAEIISNRICTSKSDSSCRAEENKYLLLRLPEGFWLEIEGTDLETNLKTPAALELAKYSQTNF